MKQNSQNIKKHFEKSMPTYEQNATVQKIMAEKMVCALSKISDNFDNILELGTGTGILTKEISKNLKFKNYYGNDIVEKSKSYITKIILSANFICGNSAKIKPNKKMDLIISNALFQWFENLEKFLETLKPKFATGGTLAFSTFTPKNFEEIREITGLTLKYKTKEEIVQALKNTGFEIIHIEEFCETVSFNTPLELLAHMKKTGVNSLSEKTWTITEVKDFCEKFSQKYPQTNLTYAPIIVIAKQN